MPESAGHDSEDRTETTKPHNTVEERNQEYGCDDFYPGKNNGKRFCSGRQKTKRSTQKIFSAIIASGFQWVCLRLLGTVFSILYNI